MQKEKIESISGLKGIACLIIMTYHYRFVLLDRGIWIADYGHFFVEVFVTISGFLMAYNYQERLKDICFKEFFLKRYLKIMPLYWVTEVSVYIAEFLAAVLAGNTYRMNCRNFFWELSGLYTGWFGQDNTPKNCPLWTVCCLLLCYLIFYLLIKIKKYSHFLYFGTITVLFGIGVGNLIIGKKNEVVFGGNIDSLRCIMSFLVGLLLFELFCRITSNYGKVLCYIWAGILLGVIINLLQRHAISDITEVKRASVSVILVLCPFILYSAIYIKSLKELYNTRLLQFLGEISMDIYMWHWVVRVYMGSRPFYVNERTWMGWIVLIICTILVSGLSHYFLTPLLYNVGKNIGKNLQKVTKSRNVQ